MNSVFSSKNISVNALPDKTALILSSKIKAWDEFKKYKGAVDCSMDEKAELADARDEKYNA